MGADFIFGVKIEVAFQFVFLSDSTEAQKTQHFKFQISLTYLAITQTFLVENSIPVPVLNTVLQCSSNGILQVKIG